LTTPVGSIPLSSCPGSPKTPGALTGGPDGCTGGIPCSAAPCCGDRPRCAYNTALCACRWLSQCCRRVYQKQPPQIRCFRGECTRAFLATADRTPNAPHAINCPDAQI